MVCLENHSAPVTKVDDEAIHMTAVQSARLASYKIPDGCRSTQVRQSVLESFGYVLTQFLLGDGLLLTDRAQFPRFESEFQASPI